MNKSIVVTTWLNLTIFKTHSSIGSPNPTRYTQIWSLWAFWCCHCWCFSHVKLHSIMFLCVACEHVSALWIDLEPVCLAELQQPNNSHLALALFLEIWLFFFLFHQRLTVNTIYLLWFDYWLSDTIISCLWKGVPSSSCFYLVFHSTQRRTRVDGRFDLLINEHCVVYAL